MRFSPSCGTLDLTLRKLQKLASSAQQIPGLAIKECGPGQASMLHCLSKGSVHCDFREATEIRVLLGLCPGSFR